MLNHCARLVCQRRGQHQQPSGERRASRRRNEGVNRCFVDPAVEVRLGLYRAQTPTRSLRLLRYQIDTDIRSVAVRLTVRPLHPEPHFLEALRPVHVGVQPERLLHNPLERFASSLGRLVTLPKQMQKPSRPSRVVGLGSQDSHLRDSGGVAEAHVRSHRSVMPHTLWPIREHSMEAMHGGCGSGTRRAVQGFLRCSLPQRRRLKWISRRTMITKSPQVSPLRRL